MIFKQNNFVVTTTLKSSIMKNSLIISLLFIGVNIAAQTPAIPTCKAEDTAGVMSDGYWAIWNDEELARIDQDIEKYRNIVFEKLSEREQLLYRKHYIENKSHSQIAEEMNTNTKNVSVMTTHTVSNAKATRLSIYASVFVLIF
jgi:uncharacterized protein YdbL (DUF1318 family)